MCAYGPVQHDTISSLINMQSHFITTTGNGFGWVAAWDSFICGARMACLKVAKASNADYLFFADADMICPEYAPAELLNAAEKMKLPIVSGFYCGRMPPHLPLIYTHNPKHIPGHKDDAAGTEDVWFFKQCAKIGVKPVIHTGVVAAHIGKAGAVLPSRDAIFKARDITTPIFYADEWQKRQEEVMKKIASRSDNHPDAAFNMHYPKKYGQLMECDVTGLGCCLIRLDILDKLEEPWFKMQA
jgi:hypothetical protein